MYVCIYIYIYVYIYIYISADRAQLKPDAGLSSAKGVRLKGSRIRCNSYVKLRDMCDEITHLVVWNKELLHPIRDPPLA